MRLSLSASFSVLSLAALFVACCADRAHAQPADDVFFADRLQPFVQKYCVSCHSGKEPEAGFALDACHDRQALLHDREKWGKAVEYLQATIMPPVDEPQPPVDEASAITTWIAGQLSQIGPDGTRDPGRVTIRRLNRVEYNNTIRDLIGTDLRPADDFPSDDVGYGFDNIGDVLSLPPVLMERYLAAAESIAHEAILPKWPPEKSKNRFIGRRMSSDKGVKVGDARRLNEEGNAFIDMRFEVDGKYIVRCRAHGEQAGDEPARMTLSVDGKKVESFAVEGTKEAPKTYVKRVQIKRGFRRVAVAFTNDYVDHDNPDPAQRDRNLVINWLEIEGPFVDAENKPESFRRIVFRQPTGSDDEEACARDVMARFATRAFRRPATDEEVASLVRLVRLARDYGDTFEQGIQLAVQAVLISPHFLFRIELDADVAGDALVLPLDDYQLASRLSYFLWSTMPDEELFSLAADKKLSEPDVLAAQVKRMLADPKSQSLVDNFAGQWLQLRNLDIASPDRARFRKFDDKMRSAMRRETELFFESIMRDNRSVLEFLDADYTFVNERLASLYRIRGVTGDEFRRVTLDDRKRGGLLSQASILTITSNPTRTSPVKRGKWVLEQLLGTPPPPPPPDVPQLEQVALQGTLREKMEQHRADPNCAVCHTRMDAIGFALENYNAIGAWREEERFRPIDASGTLPGGQTFAGPAELRELLKGKPDSFTRCLSQKLLTYALGRGLQSYDIQSVHDITERVKRDDYKFSSLVLAIVSSEPFRMRRSQGVPE